MSEQQPRPGQATLAGVLIIGGSIIVILSAWQRIATLHTLEVQAELEGVLGGSGGRWFGMGIEGLSTTIRVLCLLGAGSAAAAAILGFQIFQRSSSARVVLSVLAPFLLIGGLATNGFLAPMVVAGIVLLWLPPTRDWYAGRPWAQRTVGARTRPPDAGSPSPRESGGEPASGRAPEQPAPAPPSPAHHAQHGPPPPVHWPAAPPAAPRERGRRPGALVAACILSWTLCGLTVVAMASAMVAAGLRSEQLFADMVEQQPDLVDAAQMTEQTFVITVMIAFGGFIVWALLAIVLAVLAFIGHNWARITLVVSGASAALLVLFAAITAPLLLLVVLALGGSIAMLLRPDVNAWYRR